MMPNQDDQLFDDEQIQRFDATTIRNRYGDNWKNFASNVREVTQPDGSIVKEYMIEDPTLLEEIKTPSQSVDSTSSTARTVSSDDDHQPVIKDRFAQIKAKFEQNKSTNVMGSPSTSSGNTISTVRPNSLQQIDDLYARHRRGSNESLPNTKNSSGRSNQSNEVQNNYHHSQSNGQNAKFNTNTFRRLDSADEADEEVRQIHRQGEELRRHQQQINASSSSSNEVLQQNRLQYEVIDEDGNPIAVNRVADLIKMSGAHARDVRQPDGSIIKEYVIDDPHLLAQFRSQQNQQFSNISTYNQQRSIDNDAPPRPPRVPLRSSALLRQNQPPINENLPNDIQQIRVLEPQHRYEYLTNNGRRIQFLICNSDNINQQIITDRDIRELTNAINTRLPSSTIPMAQQTFVQPMQNPPKQWQPSIDLTQRKRLGSDTQPYSNNTNMNFQQTQPDLTRSSSSGAINQEYTYSQNQQANQRWNKFPQSNSRQQYNQSFQTKAQFLPERQATKSRNSPPNFHQQSTNYPYRGESQHGVRIHNNFNQQ